LKRYLRPRGTVESVQRSRALRPLVLASGAVLFAVAVAIPFFPRGTDLYVHVLWPWQVMRCLKAGSLPVWLPDLNASFGSPGIGLYSPLGPTVCGALGLILGTGGRGVRAALALAVLAVMAVAPGRSRGNRLAVASVVLLSPAVLTEFFGRFPVSQLLGVPFAWLLLEIAADGRWRWDRDGVLFALLWLVHAPTAIMVAALSVLSAVAVWLRANRSSTGDEGGDTRGRLFQIWQLGGAGLLAAGLTAWHWWPLVSAAPDFPLRSALTGGEHHPLRNLIGVSGPHLPEINIALGWAALGWLVALLVSGGWRSTRGRLAVVAIALTSLVSAPLWRYLAPLAWLQFPWRWMLPATLLASTAVFREAERHRRWVLGISLAAVFLPMAGIPTIGLVPDPQLGARTGAVAAGERVMAAFSGNPLLIDVKEHRPLWWQDLGPTIALLGPRRAVLVPDDGAVRVIVWRPVMRKVEVDAPQPTTLVLRLLADRHWRVTVNDHEAVPFRWGAALAANIRGGESTVEISWGTDPLTIAGVIVAASLLMWIVIRSWKAQRRSPEPRPEHRL
jgi:hypothetical protein